jgi:hypothetical protein
LGFGTIHWLYTFQCLHRSRLRFVGSSVKHSCYHPIGHGSSQQLLSSRRKQLSVSPRKKALPNELKASRAAALLPVLYQDQDIFLINCIFGYDSIRLVINTNGAVSNEKYAFKT